jgi:FeS assembly protein SufD, group 1
MKLADLSCSLSFPHRQDEDWRFTDVSFLQGMDFRLAQLPAIAPLSDISAKQQLQITDGGLIYFPNLSQGIACTISEVPFVASNEHNWDYFAQLNLQNNPTTIYCHIPDHTQVVLPLEINYQATQERSLVLPRLVIKVGANSQVTLIERFQSSALLANYLHSAVMQIHLAPSAKLTHMRIQAESPSAFHFASTLVTQAENSIYQAYMLDLGAKLSRHNPYIYSQGEGTVSEIWGLTITNGDRLSDTHSCMHHSYPNAYSRQLHKAIISDRSQVVFNGRIVVSKPAQNTDSAQLSRSLLLSCQAKINTKPQLEIMADNVKCKHGATVSQLDREEIFYLQSRGIDSRSASRLLTLSFALEVIQNFPSDALKQELTQEIKNALPSFDIADPP